METVAEITERTRLKSVFEQSPSLTPTNSTVYTYRRNGTDKLLTFIQWAVIMASPAMGHWGTCPPPQLPTV